MMVAECKEILGTYLLIQPYKIVGIPLLGFEKWKDVLEAYFLRVSVVGHMMLIFIGTLYIH